MYSKALIAARGGHCFICGTEQSLIVHHIDENRSNNHPSNLVVLCRECHIKIHKYTLKIVPTVIPQTFNRDYLLSELYTRFEHAFYLMADFDVGFSAEDIIQFMEDIGITIIPKREAKLTHDIRSNSPKQIMR